jgi:Brp/Blh family beta-carotene 15,15'-monooxygenase
MLAALLASVAWPDVVQRRWVQWLPWWVGLLAFGLPHGALDHRIAQELRGGSDEAGRIWFYAAYALLALVVMAVWWLVPVGALLGFLSVAAIHFGQGDIYWSRRFGLLGWRPSRAYAVVLWLVRGLLPIGVPILAHPDEFVALAETMAAYVSPQTMAWAVPIEMVVAGWWVVGGLVGVQTVGALALSAGGDRNVRRAAAGEAAETWLLLAVMSAVPPILAVGIYFNAWHSVRHVVRLMLAAAPMRGLVRMGRFGDALAWFVRLSGPTTLAALVSLGLLALLVRQRVVSAADLGLVVVVVISALTLPHALVVAWMDQRQGVWRMRAGSGP